MAVLEWLDASERKIPNDICAFNARSSELILKHCIQDFVSGGSKSIGFPFKDYMIDLINAGVQKKLKKNPLNPVGF